MYNLKLVLGWFSHFNKTWATFKLPRPKSLLEIMVVYRKVEELGLVLVEQIKEHMVHLLVSNNKRILSSNYHQTNKINLMKLKSEVQVLSLLVIHLKSHSSLDHSQGKSSVVWLQALIRIIKVFSRQIY